MKTGDCDETTTTGYVALCLRETVHIQDAMAEDDNTTPNDDDYDGKTDVPVLASDVAHTAIASDDNDDD